MSRSSSRMPPASWEKYLAAVLVLAGAGVMMLSSSRPWVNATVHDALAGRLVVTVDGTTVAPVVPAVALVALAGAVAVLTARTWGRRVVGLLLVVSGAAAATVAVGVVRAPLDAVQASLSAATGRTGGLGPATEVSGWPWVAVGGAVLVGFAGALALVRARRWSGPSDRYERPAALPSNPGVTTGQAQDGEGRSDPGVASGQVDPWDSLSRGQDPTE